MAEKEYDKFIVIKRADLCKLSVDQRSVLYDILEKVDNQNKYVVCNQDEPYAEEVWQTILDGETKKEFFEVGTKKP